MDKPRGIAALLMCAGMLASTTGQAQSVTRTDAKEGYLERRTPPGSVEPPRVASGRDDLAPETTYDIPPPVDDGSARRDADEAVISAFGRAYVRAKSPRIAVYFNRELSEEVREWIPDDRVVRETTLTSETRSGGTRKSSASVEGSGRTAPGANNRAGGPWDGKVEARSETTLGGSTRSKSQVTDTETTQRYVGQTGLRDDPAESLKWEFEDSVAAVFLDAGARLVDRSAMFRMMNNARPQTEGMAGSTSTTVNESRALQKFAEVLIEVLVVRSSTSNVGYDFRATAKSTGTGQLLGTAYFDGATLLAPVQQRYVAGSGGYELQTTQQLPTVGEVSRALAVKLMRSMTPRLAS